MSRKVLQPFKAERQMDTALLADKGMDFIHDDAAHGAQHFPAARAGQNEIERLRSGDQDVGRLPHHRSARMAGRVARSHRDAQRRQRLIQSGSF